MTATTPSNYWPITLQPTTPTAAGGADGGVDDAALYAVIPVYRLRH